MLLIPGTAYTQSSRGTLKSIHIANRPNLNAFASAAQWLATMGRFLLMLAAVSLITMPLTQRIWTWDHFLHGGQDFESGMLIIVAILCLAVLLSQLCKRRIDSFFAAWRLFASPLNDCASARLRLARAFSILRTEQPAGSSIDIYSLPLQI